MFTTQFSRDLFNYFRRKKKYEVMIEVEIQNKNVLVTAHVEAHSKRQAVELSKQWTSGQIKIKSVGLRSKGRV
jgi:hypothetical protein